MVVMALLSGGVGLGVWLCGRALRSRPEPIPAILARLDRPGRALTDTGPTPTAPLVERAERAAVDVLDRAGLKPPSADAAFELTGRTPQRHALDKLVGAVAGFGGVWVLGILLAIVGLRLPVVLILGLSLVAGTAGFFYPDLALRDLAERRKRAFRHALSAYFDLVNILLAGGAGIETALFAAAGAGDGWAFAQLRTALDRARHTGRSPWDSFGDLGERLGVSELSEMAASVALAGSHGARIRASLAAKADSLRGHQVAETEAAAEAATERMTIPLAVLLLGFLVLIGYPALQEIAASSGA